MRIGIIGGSFNPVHNGHIELARRAGEEFDLDKVVFMPAGNPYQKRGILPVADRIDILRAALGGEFEISLAESDETRPSYSCDTFEDLHRRYPMVTHYLIIGFDSLQNLHTWKEPERLLKNCEIIAAGRSGTDMELLRRTAEETGKRYGGKIHPMVFEDIKISSTEIRNRIRRGESIKGLLPEAAEELILERGCYREGF